METLEDVAEAAVKAWMKATNFDSPTDQHLPYVLREVWMEGYKAAVAWDMETGRNE